MFRTIYSPASSLILLQKKRCQTFCRVFITPKWSSVRLLLTHFWNPWSWKKKHDTLSSSIMRISIFCTAHHFLYGGNFRVPSPSPIVLNIWADTENRNVVNDKCCAGMSYYLVTPRTFLQRCWNCNLMWNWISILIFPLSSWIVLKNYNTATKYLYFYA